tara:strand:- start:33821 stop:34072 length:252 start_codon:yes stop_codon:yes gene_type:complete
MSSIRFALEKLDNAVGKLDASVCNVENALQDYVPLEQVAQQIENAKAEVQLRDDSGNVIDVDFVAKRLDNAIATVEEMLKDEG